jgi:hypothetical protein
MPNDQIQTEFFDWQGWSALWKLRSHQLAERGIVVTVPPDRPDLCSPYERDYHRMDQVYLTGSGGFWIAWKGATPVGHIGAQDTGSVVELRRMYV